MRKLIFIVIFFITANSFAQLPQLVIPKGHVGDISAMAISPDKKWFASGDDKGTVKLWDIQMEKELITFNYNPTLSILISANSLAFSADSKKLYSCIGSTLIISDLANGGKEVFKKKIHENKIQKLLFSSNGRMFVTAADDEVKIWESDNLLLPKTVVIKGKEPLVAFDDANNIIVITTGNYTEISESFDIKDIVSNKGFITQINSATGQVMSTTEFENFKDDALYISTDGKIVAISREQDKVGNVLIMEIASKKIIKKISSSANSVRFSNNNRFMVIKTGNSIDLYDGVSFQYVRSILSDELHGKLMFGLDDTKLFQGVNLNGSVVQWNLAEGIIEKKFGGTATFVKDLTVTPDQQSLVVLAGTNEYQSKKLLLQKLDLSSAVYSKMKYLNIENSLQKFDMAPAGGGRIFVDKMANLLNPLLVNKNATAFAISNNIKTMVTTNKYDSQSQLTFYNIEDGSKIKNIPLYKSAYTLLFSKDDKIVYVGYEGDNRIDKIEIETGRVLKSLEHVDNSSKNVRIMEMFFSNDGTMILGVNDYKKMIAWNTLTGEEIKLNLSQDAKVFSVKTIPNTNTIIYGDGDYKIQVYDLTANKVIRSLQCYSRTIGAQAVTTDGKFLFYSNNDKSISIWDLAKGEILGSMVFFDEKDWVIVDKAGRFEGTPDAMKKMYYLKGLQIIPLESGFERFFTPGLLARMLKGEKLAPPPVDIATLKAAPVVKIGYTEGGRNLVVEDDVAEYKTANGEAKIQVNASCAADAVSEIRLYQNGKLVQGTRNLVVDDDVASSPQMNKTFTVLLAPGKNIFKAIALNTQRSESIPVSLSVNYTAAKKENVPNSTITLHMLVVGINKYKNPKYNLNYAQADAEAFKTAMAGGSSSLFASSQITYLSNDEATQAGMAEAFQKIKTNALPQDLFIFYYAGHGVINDKKEFFLAPYDVTQLYGSDNALAQKGFSAAALQQMSKEIKAQKQLFILDACQSAGALTTMGGTRGAAEEKAIAQLARSTGTQWLTASGSEQLAAEFDDLGHGSFTYCILQALKGAANTGKQITVKQLDAYLQEKVPEITSKYKGTPQYPASYSYGNDFPIFIFK